MKDKYANMHLQLHCCVGSNKRSKDGSGEDFNGG